MPRADHPSPTTRQRILDAAGEVFAQTGFRDATVREICTRAGANLAAVNYYFRDKAALYIEVLDCARLCSTEQYPVDGGLGAGATAQERLGAFIRAFVLKLFDRGRPSWLTKLISREMIEPTAAMDAIVERGIAPQFAYLSGIVGEILGAKSDDPVVVYASASIIGQCLHYHHCRAVTERMFPQYLADPAFVEKTADHITRFTLHALRGLAAEVRAGAPAARAVRGPATAGVHRGRQHKGRGAKGNRP